jgi:hypothetical protein
LIPLLAVTIPTESTLVTSSCVNTPPTLTSPLNVAAATDADLSWNSTTNTLNAPTLSGNITGTAATFSGDVSVGGVLTHEDVTNVDAVGIVTAAKGVRVTEGGLVVTAGIVTAKNIIDTTDAQGNTRVGSNAGDSFDGTNANNNTLIGKNAGTAITGGDNNTAVGQGALGTNTTGSDNVAIGDDALRLNVTGSVPTAVL